ncbi:phage/plasmid primase, P4 family [Mycolicibacterium sp. ND9-15]|uniref:DNA primase family protein n=1 Tax=Mycolicibacterium sp. ND9-15 TaxID=3042320 RepID=UPI002DDABBCA|nr:phage/plasmid primase, P4 family [Mycolicibacterium sp. ND9-15]WSE56755.1 phage/plasmid primase, P4 family [Mycolicibacterium sp. ND9-15]
MSAPEDGRAVSQRLYEQGFGRRAESPPEFDADTPRDQTSEPPRLDDAHIAQYIAGTTLVGKFCWCAGMGWMRYTDIGYWEPVTEAAIVERVRVAVIALHASEARQGADAERLKRISGLFAASRIRAIVGLAKGILERHSDEFDAQPDLFCAGNGVIDLRSGKLTSHDPSLLLTKHTSVDYRPGATHSDWTKALTALPTASAEWLRWRIGQAVTGHPTPDDVMPVWQGTGANAKTTLLTAITRAVGEHAVIVPERVLLANPSDHPTELTTLKGARLAVLEETPETRHLNTKRLKDVLGTETMTARRIGKDSISWPPTHSLVISTNYRPRVDETDHGTWRRLALVRFPYTFRKPGEPLTGPFDREGDPTLRDRLKQGRDGQHEAVLAWAVSGAVDWYSNGRVLPLAPPEIENDTSAWRADSDAVLGFISEHLVFDADRYIATTDLLVVFNGWLKGRGHREWSDQTLSGRLKDHDAWQTVDYQRVKGSRPGISRPGWSAGTLGERFRAWVGVRFRTADDDNDSDSDNEGKAPLGQGGQGTPTLQQSIGSRKALDHPVHPVHANGHRRPCSCGRPGVVSRETGLCQWCELKAGKRQGPTS